MLLYALPSSLYASILELLRYYYLTDNISRIAYDSLMEKVAENLAVVSSGIKDLSSQVSVPRVISTPTETKAPDSDLFDDSDDSDSAESAPQHYTRRPLRQLNREDYENIEYWEKETYNHRNNGGRNGEDPPEGTGSAPLSCYMENENGEEVPLKEQYACRRRSRKFWEGLLRSSRAPNIWRQAPKDVEDELIHILETEFPWTRFCEDHWKAKRVATNHYSQWYWAALPRKLKKDAEKWAEKLAAQIAAMQAAGLDIDERWALKRPSDEVDDDVPGPSKRVRAEEP